MNSTQCTARLLLAAIAVGASVAGGAEPPAVGLVSGQSCESLYNAELASGARARKPLAEFLRDGATVFDGSLLGEPAARGYFCDNGQVNSQLVLLTYPTQEAALAAHARLLKRLTQGLGRPCRFPDLLPLPNRRKLLARNPWMSAEMRYVADWSQRDGVRTSLNLKPVGSPLQWQIGVMSSRTPPYACHRF